MSDSLAPGQRTHFSTTFPYPFYKEDVVTNPDSKYDMRAVRQIIVSEAMDGCFET